MWRLKVVNMQDGRTCTFDSKTTKGLFKIVEMLKDMACVEYRVYMKYVGKGVR